MQQQMTSAGPPATARSSVTADKQAAIANSSDGVVITALIKDAQGTPVPNARVTFRLTVGTGRVSEPAPTDGSGQTISHLSSSKAEPKTLAVSVDVAGTETPLAELSFTFVPGPASSGVFSTHPSTTRAGQPIAPAVTIQVTDKDGNPVTDVFSMSVRLVRSSAGVVQNGEPRESVNGVITFPNLVINRAQVGYALRAEAANGAADESRLFDVVPGDVSATASTFTADPTVVTANGTASAALTFTAKDLGGNLLSNQPVTLEVTSGTATLAASTGMTDAAGAFGTSLSSTQVGPKTVRASVGAVSLSVMVSFVP